MKKPNNIIGKKYGRLTIISDSGKRYPSSGDVIWECLCECGNSVFLPTGRITTTTRSTKSCGCLAKELNKLPRPNIKISTHGASRKGVLTGAFKSWLAMRRRCTDPKYKDYKHYKKNNINIDPTWEDFSNFLNDMGERPDNMTLERIDNKKGYNKKNCIWANRKTQGNNTSRNRIIEFNGKKQTLQAWADEIGIGRSTLAYRLNNKWPLLKALRK